jgi:hypothetical protein
MDVLSWLEAKRLVEAKRVVMGVGDDHESSGAAALGRVTRSFDEKARADSATPVRGGGVDGLEPAASASDDDAAARQDLAAVRRERHVPAATPGAEESA